MRPEIKVFCAPHEAHFCRPECDMVAKRQFVCLTSAQQALALGYTPCDSCHPAPPECTLGDVRNVFAFRANEWFSATNFVDNDERRAAKKLGVTMEQLEIDTMRRYGLGVREFFRAQKLLLILYLVKESALSIERIVRICGFDSIEEADSASKTFHLRFGKTLASLPRAENGGSREPVSLRLPYRPPYPWERMLAFLKRRAIPGVEEIENGVYRRTVALLRRNTTYTGWLEVRHLPLENALRLTVSYPLLPLLPAIIWRVEHLFDLALEPTMLDDNLQGLLSALPGVESGDIRLPGAFDGFEMGVRTVLGQQITVKAAATLSGRFVEHYGMPIETPFPGLTHIFPTARDFLSAWEANGLPENMGITRSRMHSIRALAEALQQGRLTLQPYADKLQEMHTIMQLPGFGAWSTQYLAMRALKFADAFPHSDLGIRKSMRDKSLPEILAISEDWKPYRGYATIMLWENLYA